MPRDAASLSGFSLSLATVFAVCIKADACLTSSFEDGQRGTCEHDVHNVNIININVHNVNIININVHNVNIMNINVKMNT